MGKDEEFRFVEGFPSYKVSNHGRVLNAQRNRFMSLSFNGHELTVGLMKNGKQYRRSVRRMVALAFVSGRTSVFNTPTLLDGNRRNLYASNIVWRPLWFAREHIAQFHNEQEWWFYGPIIDTTTKITYKNVYEAGVVLGSLFSDIYNSLLDENVVFPGNNVFDFV